MDWGLPVVIVGGGLAGLAAAVTLQRQGREVLILEATDTIGGRVRSEHTDDGFVLDRGFHVVCTGYPSLSGFFDITALQLRPFDSGALIAGTQPMQIVIDPFAHPERLLTMLRQSPFDAGDKLAIAKLKLELAGPSPYRLTHAAEHTTAEELHRIGISERAFRRFFEPFFGGIFLDRSLETRASWFLFIFKMLSEGQAAVPAHGIGALPAALAAQLPLSAIRLRARVTMIERNDHGVSAVYIGTERVAARAVILATDIWSLPQLHPEAPEYAPRGCMTIYFASPVSLYADRLTVLNPDPHGLINNLVQLTNIVPEYAPPGMHLISCTTLNGLELDDEVVYQRARSEIERWYGALAGQLRPLRIYRLPHAQFAQPPHWRKQHPRLQPETPGLFLAGEYLHSSSINGALQSGREAARALLAAGF
ncbi:MAG: FAD-dependent oxidoreductase [Chloroflexi bacterium]|nr:FAD-dependent oxidoreductase [Chloroflexota bacterium]